MQNCQDLRNHIISYNTTQFEDLYTESSKEQYRALKYVVFMADKDWKAKCRKIVKRAFRRHIPISEWIKKYSKEDAVCDLIAGVTISLTIIPQSIAYAALAGLDPRYGLNSAFMGSFIYVFFGSVKEVVIGPSSLMALLTFQYTNHLNVDFVVLLCFLSGCVEFIMGAFNLGFLISFISVPVVSGFTTSAALIVLISQFKGLFGIKFDSESTYESLVKLCQHVREIQVGDTILGISCIASILLLRKLKFYKVPKTVPGAKYIQKTIWFISNARNALAVFITSYISIVFSKDGGHPPFATTKAVESGIPPFILPPMSTVIGNKTYNFQEMVVELGAGYLIIPVTAVLANVAIAKAFSSGLVDATQEMIALSLCNVFGSFVQSMPTCGAFSRSAVISSSGVKSPLACLYSATLTMLAMTFLAPYFHYIPKAVLSAVLISAVLFLIDYQIVHPLWKSNKLDGCILVATTLVCLFVGVEIGLLFGVLVGLVDLIFKWSRPEVTVQKFQTQQGAYLLVTPMMGLYFPSVDYLYSLILKTNASNEDKLPILIDCSRLTGTDYSIGRSFKSLQCVLEKKGQILGLVDIQTKLKKPLEAAGCQPGMYCDSDKIEDFLFGENLNNFIALTEVSTENIIKEATKGS